MKPKIQFAGKIALGVLMILGAYCLAAGRWDLWPGWCYSGFFLLVFTASHVITSRVAPDLLVERVEWGAGVERWDRPIVLTLMFGPIVTALIAGLEARWHGVDAPGAGTLAGYALAAAGSGLTQTAMAFNRFYAPVVRIQKERKHQVVEARPYRIVRHPGNLGNVFLNAALPWMLASAWAWIPALCSLALTVVRTALEDRMLQRALPGYASFAARTRYRLIPGVW